MKKLRMVIATFLAVLTFMSFVPNVGIWNLYLTTPKVYRVNAIETGKINLDEVGKILNTTREEIDGPLIEQMDTWSNQSEKEELEKILNQNEITYRYNKTMQRTEWLFNNTMLLEVWIEDLNAIIDLKNGTQRHPICYMRQYLPLFRSMSHKYFSYYEGPLQTYDWDCILFLKAPGNETYRVAYDHPHNYKGDPITQKDGIVNGRCGEKRKSMYILAMSTLKDGYET